MTTTTVTLTVQVVDPANLGLLKRLLARSCFRNLEITTTKES